MLPCGSVQVLSALLMDGRVQKQTFPTVSAVLEENCLFFYIIEHSLLE